MKDEAYDWNLTAYVKENHPEVLWIELSKDYYQFHGKKVFDASSKDEFWMKAHIAGYESFSFIGGANDKQFYELLGWSE